MKFCVDTESGAIRKKFYLIRRYVRYIEKKLDKREYNDGVYQLRRRINCIRNHLAELEELVS